jgi:cytosine/adenosine deaminase-related metal-dependent hydrolase
VPHERPRRLAYTASWVAPVAQPPLPDGVVVVDDGRISWVGPGDDPAARDAERVELGPGVLLPGLVNAHCHLELSYLAGAVPRENGFVPWVEALVAARAAEDRGQVREGVAAALRELEQTGTVAVGDVSNTLPHVDLLARSSLFAAVFLELLAWDPVRAGGVLAAADAHLTGARHALAQATPAGAARVRIELGAHAPHSVSPPLLRALAERGGPAAIHLAESEAEARFLDGGVGEWASFLARRGLGHVSFPASGLSPVRYLDGLGALRPGLLAAHCVRTDRGDRELLARRGVSVVVCPRSNRALDVGLPRVPELLAAGVKVCLGTDSLASVDSLDLLQDAALLHRAFPELGAPAIVQMATRAGAEALGFPDLGTLEPGRLGALAFAPGPSDLADPLAFLVSGDARARRLST